MNSSNVHHYIRKRISARDVRLTDAILERYDCYCENLAAGKTAAPVESSPEVNRERTVHSETESSEDGTFEIFLRTSHGAYVANSICSLYSVTCVLIDHANL